MRQYSVLPLLLLVVAIDAGCAGPQTSTTYEQNMPQRETFEGWDRPGATKQEFVQEKYLCTREAQALAYRNTTRPSTSPPGPPLSSVLGATMEGMAVGVQQAQYFEECMEGHGWTK